MLQFQELTAAHGDRLRGYYQKCDYRLCEYSLGVKLMWRTTCIRPLPRSPAAL